MSDDYMPRQLAARVQFLLNVADVTAAHCIGSPPPRTPAWSWISTAELATVKELIQDYADAYAKATETRAPADIAVRNTREAITVPKAREFIRKNLTQDQVGEGGRTELNLPVKDTTPTPHPTPAAGPDSTSITSSEVPGVIRIRYKGAKPVGVVVCEIRYGLAETVPTDAQTLIGADNFTHNPFTLTYVNDRGKKLFYALRWRVSNGGVSPWSEIKEVIVP